MSVAPTSWDLKCFPRQTALSAHAHTPVPSALSGLSTLSGSAPGSVRSSENQREAGSRTLKMRWLKSTDCEPPACRECPPQWGWTLQTPFLHRGCDHTVPLRSQLTRALLVGLRVLSRPCLLGQALPSGTSPAWPWRALALVCEQCCLGASGFLLHCLRLVLVSERYQPHRIKCKISLLFLLPRKTMQNWCSLNIWWNSTAGPRDFLHQQFLTELMFVMVTDPSSNPPPRVVPHSRPGCRAEATSPSSSGTSRLCGRLSLASLLKPS